MKKILATLLLIGAISLGGCFESKNDKITKTDSVTIAIQDGEVVVSSLENIAGGEYVITPAVDSSKIVAAEDVLAVVRQENGATRVAIAGANKEITDGEMLFKVKGEKTFKSIELENKVTDANYEALKTEAVKSANVRGANIFRTTSSDVLLGDFNNDNTVNIADFALFSQNYATTNSVYDIGPATLGTTTGWTDIYSQRNPDGVVGILDLVVFSKNYGKSIATSVTITGDSTVEVGKTVTLTADKSVTWATSNASVATISSISGTTTVVTGVAKGAVEITATYNGKTVSHIMEVTKIDATVSSIAITGNDTATVGSVVNLTAKVSYSDGTTKDEAVTWSSSDTAVATLTPQVGISTDVTGVKAGTVTVTAAFGGKTATKGISFGGFTGIIVYVEKPTAWSEMWIWYNSNLSGTTWDTKTLKTAPGDMVNYRTGWYKKELAGCTGVEFLFCDGTWNNKLIDAAKNANFKETQTCWITKDGKVQYTDPEGPKPPAVSSSAADGSTFTSDGISVTLSVSGTNVTGGKYLVGTGDAGTSGTAFTNGQSITIGTGLSVGQTVTLKLYATNGTENATASYTYTKAKESDNTLSGSWNELRMYQVMVSSFQDGNSSVGYGTGYGPGPHNGDLRGIINSLDYIKSLGMNAVWMTPIFNSNGGSELDSTGYYTYDYFNVDPKFGTNDDLKELVTKAHEKGMYVILDGVFGHWGENVAASPTGKTPARSNGMYNACNYPASLDFFKEVATYWIDKYDIDGWRLDQCYQVGLGENGKGDGDNCYSGGRNYWYDIRTAVETLVSSRKAAGKKWGTLGYMVGEHWKGDAATIQKGTVNPGSAPGYGLKSCFDFPSRYKIVQALAVEESKEVKGTSMTNLDYLYKNSTDKGYTHPDGYWPNLFITNHDLVRFGNLVNWRFGENRSSANYWKRHKLAIGLLAPYTGPITMYYGDEYGMMTDGYSNGMNGWYNDNIARDAGKISGFSSNEQDLVNYTKALMKARSENEAMWNGTHTTLASEETFYAGKKTKGTNTVVFLLNGGSSAITFTVGAAGTDLVTGAATTSTVTVDALSTMFIKLN